MFKWLLIVSITLVSTSMLAFLSTYLAIIPESLKYYNVTRSQILLLSNSFNICYLFIAPLLFPILKRHYSLLVKTAVIFTAIGCIGRFYSEQNYNLTLLFSIIVAIGHVPIITAPYGLLDLFPDNQKGYASTIPLFIPSLGINFSILYGMWKIAGIQQPLQISNQIHNLNFYTAVLGFVSCILTLICMFLLKNQIRKINQQTQQNQQKKSFFHSIKNNVKFSKQLIIMIIGWGTILGINWTYGGMFGVFLNSNNITNKQIALFGLCANLSSALFSNLGQWIKNKFDYSSIKIILSLNFIGFLMSIFLQLSSCLKLSFFHQITNLIIAIVLLRAGLSSFVSLALVQLSKNNSSVVISSIFFYIANLSNLLFIQLIDFTENSISLGVLSLIIITFISLIYFTSKKKDNKTQMIQLQSQQSKSSQLNFQSGQ